MALVRSQSLSSSQRLHHRKLFLLAYDQGARQQGRFMTVFVRPNGLSNARLGVSATRKFGGAVQRNAAKRRFREVFRTSQRETLGGVDIVVIPRAGVLKAPLTTVSDEFHALVHRPRRPRPTSGRPTS